MKISNFNDFKLEKSRLITGGIDGGTYQKTWYDCPDGQGQDWFSDYIDAVGIQ